MSRRQVAPADAEDCAAAESEALRLLARAAQTEAGLRHRLEIRGFSPATARAAAAAMMRRGLLDEGAYAQALVARRLRRGQGRVRMAAELRARGVGERDIEEALREVGPAEETGTALAVARRMLAAGNGPKSDGDRRAAERVAGALARRGFDVATVRRALREVGVDEADSGEDL